MHVGVQCTVTTKLSLHPNCSGHNAPPVFFFSSFFGLICSNVTEFYNEFCLFCILDQEHYSTY